MSASLSSATRRRKNYLGATSGDLDDVALVMLDTGLRMGEALKLECSDVRLDPAEGAKHGYVTVRARNGKNSESRNVPITARVARVLKQRLSLERLVFHR